MNKSLETFLDKLRQIDDPYVKAILRYFDYSYEDLEYYAERRLTSHLEEQEDRKYVDMQFYYRRNVHTSLLTILRVIEKTYEKELQK